MSKELEALKEIFNGMYNGQGFIKEFKAIEKALTPPTADEVCKALREQLKTPIKIGKNKHGITFNYVNTGKKLISTNYHLVNITVQLPPHLITMIGKFYEGEIK